MPQYWIPAPMSSIGSITAWIDHLRAGDRAAAQPLWQRYFQRLVVLARQKLRHAPCGLADAEDVVLDAFDSFCRGMEQGRFPQLNDRDDLWRLLLVITERKAINLIKHERRIRRGGGRVMSLDAIRDGGDSSADPMAGDIADPEPTPELAAQVAEECRRLLSALDDEALCTVALAKMEGYTNREIAERLELSEPTIERKLRRIRKTWQKELTR